MFVNFMAVHSSTLTCFLKVCYLFKLVHSSQLSVLCATIIYLVLNSKTVISCMVLILHQFTHTNLIR